MDIDLLAAPGIAGFTRHDVVGGFAPCGLPERDDRVAVLDGLSAGAEVALGVIDGHFAREGATAAAGVGAAVAGAGSRSGSGLSGCDGSGLLEGGGEDGGGLGGRGLLRLWGRCGWRRRCDGGRRFQGRSCGGRRLCCWRGSVGWRSGSRLLGGRWLDLRYERGGGLRLLEELAAWRRCCLGGCGGGRGHIVVPDSSVDDDGLGDDFGLSSQVALLDGSGGRKGGEKEGGENTGSLHDD